MNKEARLFAYFSTWAANLPTSDAEIVRLNKPYEGDIEPLLATISKLLLNSWSSEYALRITPVVNDEQYLQSSLHWTFPQAYYSTLFSARALLATMDKRESNEKRISIELGKLVYLGYYPKGLSFAALGVPGSGSFIRSIPELNPLLLKTRLKQLNALVNDLGYPFVQPVKELGAGELKMLSSKIGFTSWFNLMARLRISSVNRELEGLLESEIDVRQLHQTLIQIVEAINLVHELHIVRAIGVQAYERIINALPTYLQNTFVRQRLSAILERKEVFHAL